VYTRHQSKAKARDYIPLSSSLLLEVPGLPLHLPLLPLYFLPRVVCGLYFSIGRYHRSCGGDRIETTAVGQECSNTINARQLRLWGVEIATAFGRDPPLLPAARVVLVLWDLPEVARSSRQRELFELIYIAG
jgi:hypothetical protein